MLQFYFRDTNNDDRCAICLSGKRVRERQTLFKKQDILEQDREDFYMQAETVKEKDERFLLHLQY